MANFGIGLGAFADGFARGIGLRRQMKANKREEKAMEREEAREKAFAQAKADYDALPGGQASAPNENGVQTFPVGESGQPQPKQKMSFTDYLYGQALPKIIDSTIASGDLDTAEKLRKWGEDANERKFMDGFGRALNAFAAAQSDGNYAPFAEQTMKLLNNGGYGITATGFEMVKDDQGNQTGIKFNLKDGDREYSHTFNSMEEAGQFIAGQGDPRTRVKLFHEQAAAGAKFKAEIAKEEAKARIGLGKDVALEDVKQGNRLQLAAANSKADRGAQAKMNMLLEAGYPKEQVNRWMPQILGIRDDERQRMSSDDVLKFAYDTLGKDFDYQDAPPDVKKKMVDDFVKAFRMKSDSIAEERNPRPSPGITGSQQPPVPVW